jgi:hypothetical protein
MINMNPLVNSSCQQGIFSGNGITTMGTKGLKGVKNNDLFVRGAETYFVEK